MQTSLTTKQYREILGSIAQLSAEELIRLIEDISTVLRDKMTTESPAAADRTEKIASVKGKYAYVETSSDKFARRKQEEIELEG